MLGKRLKQLRKDQGLTLEDLALFLNVSKPSVWGYENNSVQPSLSVLVKMADRFNVSLDYILCRTDEKYNSNLSAANKNKEIISKIHNLLDELK